MQEKLENESNKIAGSGWCIYSSRPVQIYFQFQTEFLNTSRKFLHSACSYILLCTIFKICLGERKKTQRLFAKSSASSLDLKWLALIRSFREQLQNSNSNATAEFILKFIKTLQVSYILKKEFPKKAHSKKGTFQKRAHSRQGKFQSGLL